MHFTHAELDLLYECVRKESRRMTQQYGYLTDPTIGSQMDRVYKLDQKLSANLVSRRNGFA